MPVPPAPAARVASRPHVVLAVFAGGALGTLARAAVVRALPHDPGAWPWATLAANVLGAFLLGWWATRVVRSPDLDPRARPFLTTGICGGLTTFSTLQVEFVTMAREGELALAGGYAAATLVLGLLAVVLGRAAAGRTGPAAAGAHPATAAVEPTTAGGGPATAAVESATAPEPTTAAEDPPERGT